MKTKFRLLWLVVLTLVLHFSCKDETEQLSLGELTEPSNIIIESSINELGSGKVTFTTKADNTYYYHYYFGNSPDEDPYISNDGKASNTYQCQGENTYRVRVVVYGKGGTKSEQSIDILVKKDTSDVPSDILSKLTGSGTKCWQWKQSEAGHLGLGEELTAEGTTNYEANWYEAGPNEKSSDGCLYEDVLSFSKGTSGCVLKYQLYDPSGRTFFRQEAVNAALGVSSPNEDLCYSYDKISPSDVSFKRTRGSEDADVVAGKTTGVEMTFSSNGFMSFYLGSSRYEILSITDDELKVRVVQDYENEDSKGRFTWYQTFKSMDDCPTFVTNPPTTPTTSSCDELPKTADPSSCSVGGATGNTGTGDFSTLVWTDEFDTDGSPCTKNWTYDLGDGCPNLCGWGNGEAQYYTNRPQNVIIEDGILKIRAIKETYFGKSYTSTRMKSKGLQEFKYGKVVVRAKLPEGGGTWPAIWMLGANIDQVGWPACGEIDIMEHVGNDQNTVHGTLHYPENSGGNANGNKTTISTASSEFHDYEVQWTSSSITFYVDGNQYHSFTNSSSVPFNHDFFILLNIAMGGGFGGNIDPNFSCSTMEIDYVRIYQ